MDELKPCPFCGCKAQTIKTTDEQWHGVRCRNVDCIANDISPEYALLSKAIGAWNRRVEDEKAD